MVVAPPYNLSILSIIDTHLDLAPMRQLLSDAKNTNYLSNPGSARKVKFAKSRRRTILFQVPRQIKLQACTTYIVMAALSAGLARGGFQRTQVLRAGRNCLGRTVLSGGSWTIRPRQIATAHPPA